MRILSAYQRQPGDLDWDGAVNARRISGDFYRMGRHEWVTGQGWHDLASHGVRTVIDLRNPGEVGRREFDPEVDAAAHGGIQLLNLPLEEPGRERFERIAVPYMNHPSMYRLVCEEFGPQLRAVFEAMAAAEGNVVIHCSAGRDRTGLVAALLLDLAGRRGEIPGQDELAVRGINEWHRVSPRKHPYESHQDEARLREQIASRADALEEFLAWLGGAGEYLRGLGLEPGQLDALRAKALKA